MGTTIVKARKEVKNIIDKIKEIRALIDSDELEVYVEKIEQFRDDVEESLDKLNDKDNLNEREDIRQTQYTELFDALNSFHSDLEDIRRTWDALESRVDEFENLDQGTMLD